MPNIFWDILREKLTSWPDGGSRDLWCVQKGSGSPSGEHCKFQGNLSTTPHVQWKQLCRFPVVLPLCSSNVCWKHFQNGASSSSLLLSSCIYDRWHNRSVTCGSCGWAFTNFNYGMQHTILSFSCISTFWIVYITYIVYIRSCVQWNGIGSSLAAVTEPERGTAASS